MNPSPPKTQFKFVPGGGTPGHDENNTPGRSDKTLPGHRSACVCIEFHPFGEFFASGSTDTNLKVWDVRRKGCLQTYRGHSGAVGAVRFSPDGRWVVSGGADSAIKVWDLTGERHPGHHLSVCPQLTSLSPLQQGAS